MCDDVKEVIAEEKCMQKIASKQCSLRKSYPCQKIYCNCKQWSKRARDYKDLGSRENAN